MWDVGYSIFDIRYSVLCEILDIRYFILLLLLLLYYIILNERSVTSTVRET